MSLFRGVFKWGSLGLLILLIPIISYSQDSSKTQYGWVQFMSNVDSLYIVTDNNFSTYIPIANGDSLRLQQGDYQFTFVNPKFWDEKMSIQVSAHRHIHFLVRFHHRIRKDFNRSSYKRITEGMAYNLILGTDPNSTVIIDDSTYGKHFIKTDVGPYYHTIEIKHPTAVDQRKKIYIEPSEQVKLNIYDRPSRTSAYLFGLIPGASQLYKNQKLKGFLFLVVISGSAVLTTVEELRYHEVNSQYKDLKNRYEMATDETIAYNYSLTLKQKNRTLNKIAQLRDVALSATLSIYAANIIDALLVPPASGYRVSIVPGITGRKRSLSLNVDIPF